MPRLSALACAGFLLVVHDRVASNPGPEHQRLAEAVGRALDVKAFGETIGIVASDSLTASTRTKPGVSRLWIWLQKRGTLATDRSMDFVLQLGFGRERAKVPLESVRHWREMGGYSYYWRHSNEFESDADAAAITLDFAHEPVRRQVEVVLHEDLHANAPFKLWPFHINEAVVTPLADLAALAFFRSRHDTENVEATEKHIREQRSLSRELNQLVEHIGALFARGPLEAARKQALQAVEESEVYARFFRYDAGNQSPDDLLEAKVSHDWAYYGLYDRLVQLYEENGGRVEKLIEIFKAAPPDGPELTAFMQRLHHP